MMLASLQDRASFVAAMCELIADIEDRDKATADAGLAFMTHVCDGWIREHGPMFHAAVAARMLGPAEAARILGGVANDA